MLNYVRKLFVSVFFKMCDWFISLDLVICIIPMFDTGEVETWLCIFYPNFARCTVRFDSSLKAFLMKSMLLFTGNAERL